MIALAASALLALLFAASLVRLARGPTTHDRALAAHAAILAAALLTAALGVFHDQPGWIDVALALCFADLVLAAAAFRLLSVRSLQAPVSRLDAE
ncbi:MAG: multiple resistance and pH regulation protein F [Hyphomonadaceae bacterium]